MKINSLIGKKIWEISRSDDGLEFWSEDGSIMFVINAFAVYDRKGNLVAPDGVKIRVPKP